MVLLRRNGGSVAPGGRLMLALLGTALLAAACGSDTAAGETSSGHAGNPADADRTIAVQTLDSMAFEPAVQVGPPNIVV